MEETDQSIQGMAASYREAELARHRGNPLIEALPPIPSDDDLNLNLAVDLPNTAAERTLPAHIRVSCVQALNDWFEPFDYHAVVARRIDAILREGYVGRNPLNSSTLRHSHYVALRGKDGVPAPSAENRTARSMFLTGLSRVGKSRTIGRAFSIYPQYIVHTAYNGRPLPLTQLVWVHSSCPKNGSIRDACVNIIDRIDGALGVPEYRRRISQYSRGGNTGLIPLVERAAREINLGILAFDEINRLRNASVKESEIPPFLHELIDTVGIPVLFCGTYAAYGYFRGSLQEIARVTGSGKYEIPRFERGLMWTHFMECLWDHQWLQQYQPITAEDVEIFFQLTKGVQEFAITLWKSAQIYVISNNSERVTHDVLRSIAQTELELLQKPLEVLDSQDMQAKLNYLDMVPGRDDVLASRDQYVQQIITKEIADIVIDHLDKRWNALTPGQSASPQPVDASTADSQSKAPRTRANKTKDHLESDDVRAAANTDDVEKALRDAGMMSFEDKLEPNDDVGTDS